MGVLTYSQILMEKMFNWLPLLLSVREAVNHLLIYLPRAYIQAKSYQVSH